MQFQEDQRATASNNYLSQNKISLYQESHKTFLQSEKPDINLFHSTLHCHKMFENPICLSRHFSTIT